MERIETIDNIKPNAYIIDIKDISFDGNGTIFVKLKKRIDIDKLSEVMA